jgi:hypothetical protein
MDINILFAADANDGLSWFFWRVGLAPISSEEGHASATTTCIRSKAGFAAAEYTPDRAFAVVSLYVDSDRLTVCADALREETLELHDAAVWCDAEDFTKQSLGESDVAFVRGRLALGVNSADGE